MPIVLGRISPDFNIIRRTRSPAVNYNCRVRGAGGGTAFGDGDRTIAGIAEGEVARARAGVVRVEDIAGREGGVRGDILH